MTARTRIGAERRRKHSVTAARSVTALRKAQALRRGHGHQRQIHAALSHASIWRVRRAIRGAGGRPRADRDQPAPGAPALIRSEGDEATCVWLLHEGWVGSAIDLPNAKRQLVKIHLPGDVLGSTSMCLVHACDTLEALSDAWVSVVPFAAMGDIFEHDPRGAAAFLLSVQKERLTLMHRLAAVTRTSAYDRVAGLLLDLLDRGRRAGLVEGATVRCPLTQVHLADVIGLSHRLDVNWVMRRLNEAGLIEGTYGRFVVLDEPGLRALSPFRPQYVETPAWLPPARPRPQHS
ncbi:Crp/Fnr family transcriptional regulator [Sphingomonas sp. MMS24-JH45]